MRTRSWLTIALLVAAVLAWPQPAAADGIIIPDPPPWPEPPPLRDTWLTIRYHRVEVTIEDQVAVTRVEQEFVNEHEWEAEGTYIFPLPAGAAVSKFVMWVDGQPIEGKILAADEARQIYEDTVRRRRDPALLEYVGQGAVQARIFPIPPGGSRTIALEYTQVLPLENGQVAYIYPLSTEKFSARALEEVSIHVELRSREPIRAIYSPTHQDRVYIEREGERVARVGYEESDVLPNTDFELVYTLSPEDVGLTLLSYREPPDDGFFLLLAAPAVAAQARAIPKDVLLVLDTSGSMEGEKIEQARQALIYVLRHLGAEDRFNIVAFSTGLQTFARGLQGAAEAERAIAWVERLEALGGTDINRALLEALAQAEPGSARPTVLVFLTDGLPTEGVVEVGQILANVRAAAPEGVRLFAFGVGDDVNTLLLDTLAQEHHGAVSYVRPGERIDEEVSAFWAKVSMPVLANLALDFGDVVVADVYPDPLPDLFAGTQLIVVGRYREPGRARIRLSGDVAGQAQHYHYEATFRADGGEPFIPRLWATRKIGHLLTQIRLQGEEREWVEAVVALSLRYGIITPYTSFLIDEERLAGAPLLSQAEQEKAVEEFLALPTLGVSGAPAAEAADEQARLRLAEAPGGLPLPAEAAQVLRVVGAKTFVLQNGVWVDTAFVPEEMETRRVGFGSEAYFELLAARPEWGAYLALGERVLFAADGVAYEVVEGDAGPLVLPEATTPAPSETPPPADTPAPTPTPGAALPTPTVAPNSPDGGGPCAAGLILGLVALAMVVVALRARG